jgi:hypothetical protein
LPFKRVGYTEFDTVATVSLRRPRFFSIIGYTIVELNHLTSFSAVGLSDVCLRPAVGPGPRISAREKEKKRERAEKSGLENQKWTPPF